LARGGPFVPAPELAAIAGVEPLAFGGLLAALGYRVVIIGGEKTFIPSARRRRATDKGHAGERRQNKDILLPSCGS
jgi:hypothetical protein